MAPSHLLVGVVFSNICQEERVLLTMFYPKKAVLRAYVGHHGFHHNVGHLTISSGDQPTGRPNGCT